MSYIVWERKPVLKSCQANKIREGGSKDWECECKTNIES